MRGLFILLLFQTFGELGTRLLNLPLPGPVLGMFLLFAYLAVRGFVPESVDKSSQFLIHYLGLLLIPAATGFGYYLADAEDQIIPILVAATFGTILTIIIVALLMDKLIAQENNNE
ncbi:CidA/LrgA family protein [Parendozoicomonas haliclonae]|uniref:Holin-like protein CidA n=1 Tax=Parendozoicomonas haliclonae TaxID=1960125 RepID=A0A1X7AIW6_9GAMM|nr:CidA/LrgA family protein [Parendozoicomonas haliclonae]SMA45662.1 hypothetical protein EHSB41UT_01973 [Parendozoicomonas haliclonae]